MQNTKQATATAHKINAIRLAAQTSLGTVRNTCTTCNRPAGNPKYRSDDRGRILQGCVDSYHVGQLIGEAERHFMSEGARELRRQTLRDLEAL